nr:MAG TPA: hypothetical protein [Caudoviricetes sp.]
MQPCNLIMQRLKESRNTRTRLIRSRIRLFKQHDTAI